MNVGTAFSSATESRISTKTTPAAGAPCQARRIHFVARLGGKLVSQRGATSAPPTYLDHDCPSLLRFFAVHIQRLDAGVNDERGRRLGKALVPSDPLLPRGCPRRFLRMNKPLAFILASFSWITLSMHAAELKHDIEYGRAGDETLLLDAHIPDGDGLHPVAILVHGGGWSRGDKSGLDEPTKGADITPWFAPLNNAGFTWFSINYRLAPVHRWPAGFEDVQTAIRWVKQHAPEYKGDPERIALLGYSAGGHLVTLAGTHAAPDTKVQAVVAFAPQSHSNSK